MVKSDLKLGTYLKNKQTGQVYVIVKRIRHSNKRGGWDRYTVEKLNNKNVCSYLKYRMIRKHFTIDKTAHILYSK